MGTRFRTMLAPIDRSTGDGRRFQTGGIELAPTPFAFEWVRSREGGHDGAVTVGAVQETSIASVADALAAGWITPAEVKESGLAKDDLAIWAQGVMFDDADREQLPELAQDVAHAMHLAGERVLGPSVDLDSFEGIPVREGTDEEITWEDIEQAEMAGEDLKVELLITAGRVRAATLVSIPAFMETSRPFAFIEEDAEAAAEAVTLAAQDPDTIVAAARESAAQVAALVASVSQPSTRPAAAMFDMPALTGPTPITFDWDKGVVYGHAALFASCHVGFEDVCVTVPKEDSSYAWFNRFPIQTQDGGAVWAGRLTVGGRHPGLSLTASATMSAYDGKTVAADVRAYADEFGIVLAGPIRPDLDDAAKRVLSRRKVSGDWRETSSGLSLVEMLALSPGPRQHSEPGFPVATHVTHGRQVALVASLGPDPDSVGTLAVRLSDRDIDRVLERREAREREQLARREAAEALSATVSADRDVAVAEARTMLAGVLEGS